MGILTGKVAVITGGTSGIGEGIVEAFVKEGASVVVAARREAEGQALEKRLGVRFVKTDLASESDVKAMIAAAVGAFGRLDCLVNNAGVPSPIVGVADIEAEHIDQLFAINVRGLILATKHAAPVMTGQGAGSIINIASVASHRGGISGHIYTATKGAVTAFTRSSAAELGEKGVRVNSISPGAIVTGIFGKLAGVEASKADKLAESMKGAFAGLQPVPRAGMPADIASAAVFLASDGASFISGQDITIDGGMTATTKGWSYMVAGRSEMSRRLKEAAASL